MLQVITTEKAREIIKNQLSPIEDYEIVPLSKAKNRILGEKITAKEDLPIGNRSTVDGYAVKARETFGATEAIPALLKNIGEIHMGEFPEIQLKENQCIKISTGGFIPTNADASVMIEDTDSLPDDTICVRKPVSPYGNLTLKGDDIKKGSCVLDKGIKLGSREIGVLASMGINKVKVVKKLLVGIFSTGDELLNTGENIKCGQMYDVNRAFLKASLEEESAEFVDYGILPDDFDLIEEKLKIAAEKCHMVIFSGSTSAGLKDYGEEIIKKLGEIYWHGLAVKPGKPTLAGKINNAFILDLPGHPSAAFLIWQSLGKLALKRLAGESYKAFSFKTVLAERISSNDGRELLLPVKIIDSKAYPVHNKSGLIYPLMTSDGYISIERDCEGKKEGTEIEVIKF